MRIPESWRRIKEKPTGVAGLMHSHGNPNRQARENPACNAALQIRPANQRTG
jgi:hypothetical protein